LGAGKFKDVPEAAGPGRKASSVGRVFADVFNRGRLDLSVNSDSWLAGANNTEAQLRERKHTVERPGERVGSVAGSEPIGVQSVSHQGRQINVR
jgi:hypothetical protein